MAASRIWFAVLMVWLTIDTVLAKEITDTVGSAPRDRAIISYDVRQTDDGQFIVELREVRKLLRHANQQKYPNFSEVRIVFFDRIGDYPDKTEFSGNSVKAFMVPHNMKYEGSDDGYFLLAKDGITLPPLRLTSGEQGELEIPIYLAHYEKRGRYEVFSNCGELVVKLKKNTSIADNGGGSAGKERPVIVMTEESSESEFTESDEANILIRQVNDLLDEQEEYPFSQDLTQSKTRLQTLSYRITDAKLSSRISDVLSAYKQKEKNLKQQAEAAQAEAERAAERKVEEMQREEKCKADSIRNEEKRAAEEKEKRNIWLLIGGAILAALLFVGKQVFQYMSGRKRDQTIQDMQNRMVKQAESEARRRARNMAQGQMNRMEGEARRKTHNALNSGMAKLGKGLGKGKGKKGFSI